jgi:hypothetical protein
MAGIVEWWVGKVAEWQIQVYAESEEEGCQQKDQSPVVPENAALGLGQNVEGN